MGAPKTCECGRRIQILISPIRNPKSRKGSVKALKGHDLCPQCWKELLSRAHAEALSHSMGFAEAWTSSEPGISKP